MEMTLGLSAGLLIGRGVKGRELLFYLPLTALLWTALILCNSRGGIVSMVSQVLAITVVFVISRSFSKTSKQTPSNDQALNTRRRFTKPILLRLSFAFLLLTFVIGGAFLIGGDSLRRRFELAPRELVEETATRKNSHRLAIWRATASLILAHPIAGVGLGAYSTAIPKYHDASGTWVPQEAHNDYLELAATGGLISVGIAIWFLAICFKRTRNNLVSTSDQFTKSARIGCLIGLTGVAIHSLVDFGLHITVNTLILHQ
jgi:O-antigen ligase